MKKWLVPVLAIVMWMTAASFAEARYSYRYSDDYPATKTFFTVEPLAFIVNIDMADTKDFISFPPIFALSYSWGTPRIKLNLGGTWFSYGGRKLDMAGVSKETEFPRLQMVRGTLFDLGFDISPDSANQFYFSFAYLLGNVHVGARENTAPDSPFQESRSHARGAKVGFSWRVGDPLSLFLGIRFIETSNELAKNFNLFSFGLRFHSF